MRRPIVAAVYDRIMAPLERSSLAGRRRSILTAASTPVLEIGAGTGANLSYYPPGTTLIASEPERAMLDRYSQSQGDAPGNTCLLLSRAEEVPFPSETFETVVSTFVLCSVNEPEVALDEIYRVLRAEGKLIFIEHIRDEGRRGRWQDRIEPVWSRLSGGCHPNRQTLVLMERAGFSLERVESFDPSNAAGRLVRLACQPFLPFVCGEAKKLLLKKVCH